MIVTNGIGIGGPLVTRGIGLGFIPGGVQTIPEGPRQNTNEKRRRKQEEDILRIIKMIAPNVFKYFDGKRRR